MSAGLTLLSADFYSRNAAIATILCAVSSVITIDMRFVGRFFFCLQHLYIRQHPMTVKLVFADEKARTWYCIRIGVRMHVRACVWRLY